MTAPHILKAAATYLLVFMTGALFSSCAPVDDESEDRPDLSDADIPAQENFDDAFEINSRLGRGVNLGNALEAPSEGEWGMTIEKEFLEHIRDAGFESVRIPVRWNAHADISFPYTIDTAFLERVDEVVGWALDHGLAVMINIHHYDALMQQPEGHKPRLLELWKQIAFHFRHHSENLIFEILNEPHGNLTPVLWNQYLKEAITVIRETNPNRVLAVGTSPWGGFGALRHLVLPEDDRQLVVTVHYYEPFRFTHQGAGWVDDDTDAWLGTTWDATEPEKTAIDEAFDTVQQWAELHNRPVHVGEFGAFSTADDDSRKRWTAYVRESSEARGFSWAYWEFGAGFGVYDRDAGSWREELLRALLPGNPDF